MRYLILISLLVSSCQLDFDLCAQCVCTDGVNGELIDEVIWAEAGQSNAVSLCADDAAGLPQGNAHSWVVFDDTSPSWNYYRYYSTPMVLGRYTGGDTDRQHHFSPTTYAVNSGAADGIFKLAVGGSKTINRPARDWSYSNVGNGELLDVWCTEWFKYKQQRNYIGFNPILEQLVWIQGESDCADNPVGYEARMIDIINHMRDCVGYDFGVVVVMLPTENTSSCSAADNAILRAEQTSLCSNMTNVDCIDHINYETCDSGVHYSQDYVIDLGIRLLTF